MSILDPINSLYWPELVEEPALKRRLLLTNSERGRVPIPSSFS